MFSPPSPPGNPVGEPTPTGPDATHDEAPLPGEPPLPALSAPLQEQLRVLPLRPFSDLQSTGAEFALALIRRAAGEPVALLGEVQHDLALLEQAARRLAH